MADEAAVQRFVRKLIEQGRLLTAIQGVASVRQAAAALRSDEIIPVLSIDGMQRERTVLTADEALSALDELEIVSDNTSISRRSGEILRPDFVLYNRRQGRIVLVELKDDALPERQAVGELLAYERELHNHFPFLGRREIVFVLIAREWTDLLSHAYAGMAAAGRAALLGLKLNGDDPNYQLTVRCEEAWTSHHHVWIGPTALRSRSYVVLFPSDISEPYIRLMIAADLMRQTADRLGQQGFCFVWEMPDRPHALGISLYAVDPAHLFQPAAELAEPRRESELTSFFERLFLQERMAHQRSLDALVDTLEKALGPPLCATFLKDGHWSEDLEWLERKHAQPCEFRYWGMFADFSVRLATNRAALQHYQMLDPPCVEAAIPGFQIVSALTGNQPFAQGRITAKPVFQFGRLLRQAADLAAAAPADGVAWNWVQLRLLPFTNELNYLARSWVDRTEPPAPLRLFGSPDEQSAANIRQFRGWIEALLAYHPLLEVLHAGWYAGGRSTGGRSVCEALAEAIAGVQRDESIWVKCRSFLPNEAGAATDAAQLPKILRSWPEGALCAEQLVEVADRWMPELKRRQRPIQNVSFDLEGLRRGIDDKLKTLPPEKLPCIVVSADGSFGSTIIPRPPGMPSLKHGEEVAVLNSSSGSEVITIFTWAELNEGCLEEMERFVFAEPLSLEDWRPVTALSRVDNRWLGPRKDFSHCGFHPDGSVGARFFNLALSEGAPSEIAIVINTTAADKQEGGWDSETRFEIGQGVCRFREACIGFVQLHVTTDTRQERHLLLFDACDRFARQALEHLARQTYVHFFIARCTGQILDVQECPNIYEFEEYRAALELIEPGKWQAHAREFIVDHRAEIEGMLTSDRLADPARTICPRR